MHATLWKLTARTLVAFAGVSLALAAAATGSITGTVRDYLGAPRAEVLVTLQDAQRTVVQTTRTDAQGRYSLTAVPQGSYLLVASLPGVPERRVAVQVAASPVSVELSLEAPHLSEEVTVTANPGLVEPVDLVSQQVNVIDERKIGMRAKAVVAQAADEEVGIHLQRTSSSLAGIFVRGLTGNKVNVYVDGQRFSTGAMRGGINTFMSLIDPAVLEGMEVLRGPSSAQYGSDAIGGSVQFLTHTPSFSAGGTELSGSTAVGFNSADTSLGASVTGSVALPNLAVLGTIGYRDFDDVRAGGGTDSHNAVRRFFEVDPKFALDDGSLPGTGFTQSAGMLKAAWAVTPRDRIQVSYLRSQQQDGNRYDQLIGGDGNLISELNDVELDYGSLRYSRSGLGFLDSLTAGYSFNQQSEERVNQGGNGNPDASINHEFERTTVHGFQASASKIWARNTLLFGADYGLEEVDAPSFGVSPATGAKTVRRGRVPDGAEYDSGGVYVQDVFELVPDQLRLVGNLRWSTASYDSRSSDSPLVGGQPLWPDDSQDFSSVTFRAGAVWAPHHAWSLSANVSSGFRAPHITDLGTVGLVGTGFEVSPAVISGMGATVGTTADAAAKSTGDSAEELDPEESLSYEIGIGYHGNRLETQVNGFVNNIEGNIQKQALILPQGAVGTSLGDEVISAQTPDGAVFVPASPNPVLINANFDDARIWGIEAAADYDFGGGWAVGTVLTYLHAEDERTHLPPNIEGGTPAPDGWLHLRWAPAGAAWWAEAYVHAAMRQDRLSTLDLGDRRAGASRSAGSISNFFNNGARARGMISNGPDGIAGTTDDFLKETGETLAEIQARVLGPGSSASLYTAIPGYAMFGLRGGFRLAAGHELLMDLENIGDRNYRGISWGMDAPGWGIFLRYAGRF